MARVAQGGPAHGLPLADGKWQHPNVSPQSKQPSRWAQDKRWGLLIGGGPKVGTVLPPEPKEGPEEPKDVEPIQGVRNDLLPRDKKKYWGTNHGRRDMRRRKPSRKGKRAAATGDSHGGGSVTVRGGSESVSDAD